VFRAIEAKKIKAATSSSFAVRDPLAGLAARDAGVTAALVGQGLGESIGLITTARFLAARMAWRRHVAPEAWVGGTDRVHQEGDSITMTQRKEVTSVELGRE